MQEVPSTLLSSTNTREMPSHSKHLTLSNQTMPPPGVLELRLERTSGRVDWAWQRIAPINYGESRLPFFQLLATSKPVQAFLTLYTTQHKLVMQSSARNPETGIIMWEWYTIQAFL